MPDTTKLTDFLCVPYDEDAPTTISAWIAERSESYMVEDPVPVAVGDKIWIWVYARSTKLFRTQAEVSAPLVGVQQAMTQLHGAKAIEQMAGVQAATGAQMPQTPPGGRQGPRISRP